jgi:uncharacterized damage-inducible protein DinB
MAIKDGLIPELKHEAASTKKLLEKVPAESFAWKPHEKSMTLGRLATHIAQIPRWMSNIILHDEYDFAANPYKADVAGSSEELIKTFNEIYHKALADLEAADDEVFHKIWTVKSGEQIFYQLPKKVAIRGWAYNHLYHHRGQLSVYLRLLNIPVPGMYGPSADERM